MTITDAAGALVSLERIVAAVKGEEASDSKKEQERERGGAREEKRDT
jgi:hypothetical protein